MVKNANCNDSIEGTTTFFPIQISIIIGDINHNIITPVENTLQIRMSFCIDFFIHTKSFLAFASVYADQKGVVIIANILKAVPNNLKAIL